MPRIIAAFCLLIGCSAGEGIAVFDGPVPNSVGDFHARVGRLADGTLVTTLRLRLDSGTTSEVQRRIAQGAANRAVEPQCSGGWTSPEPPGPIIARPLDGATLELRQRSTQRCTPDLRTPEQIRAARKLVLESQFHRDGIGPYDRVDGRPPPF